MLISIFSKINTLNSLIFALFDNYIENLSLSDWIKESILDSFHLLPLLFIIFVIIEIIEFKYAEKIPKLMQKYDKFSIIFASVAAILPQCGFSIIAASLYAKKMITLGCLIAVFLTTSDETIPVLLAIPEKSYLIIPIVGIKLFVGILSGYIIDYCINRNKKCQNKIEIEDIKEEGCCKHEVETENKKNLILHPIIHTINTFGFIFIITLLLNYGFTRFSIENIINGNKIFQPIISAIVGLIPNCAVSIGITLMLTKGLITFGTTMSCLLSNAGLGLLVLLKNNDFIDNLKIIAFLLFISVLVGIEINFIFE